MPGEAADGAESTPVLRTLADKVNWLIDRAHPAGRGPYTNNEVADLIEKTVFLVQSVEPDIRTFRRIIVGKLFL